MPGVLPHRTAPPAGKETAAHMAFSPMRHPTPGNATMRNANHHSLRDFMAPPTACTCQPAMRSRNYVHRHHRCQPSVVVRTKGDNSVPRVGAHSMRRWAKRSPNRCILSVGLLKTTAAKIPRRPRCAPPSTAPLIWPRAKGPAVPRDSTGLVSGYTTRSDTMECALIPR